MSGALDPPVGSNTCGAGAMCCYTAAKLEIAEAENERMRAVLQEIADAKGFDNIGRWARRKARGALSHDDGYTP